MRVFKEEQRFNQWWLYVLILIPLTGVLFPIFVNDTEKDLDKGMFIGVAIIAIVFTLILTLKLQTKIDRNGIDARFTPLSFFHKHFEWTEIAEIHVRKYAAISEYGGYGVRGVGKANAYNVKGDRGIQIVTKNGYKFLIGTQNPTDAQKTINYYQNKDI